MLSIRHCAWLNYGNTSACAVRPNHCFIHFGNARGFLFSGGAHRIFQTRSNTKS